MRAVADQEAVERGAALLDARLPGWREVIDPDSLRLQSGCQCVLGQLFGSYDRGVTVLGLSEIEVRSYGFYRTRSAWTALSNAWRRVVAA